MIMAASMTGMKLLGQGWNEQNASQHCETSHGSLLHSTFMASGIGMKPFGQPMKLQKPSYRGRRKLWAQRTEAGVC